MTHPASKLLAPRRRLCQSVATLIVLFVPFVRFDGVGLLRIDLQRRRLEAFGTVFPLEDLFLLLLASLALVFLFLLVTLVLGRVWCGWACPQTTLSDLAEWGARRLGLEVTPQGVTGSPAQKALFHLFCLGLGLLVALNLVWYFIPPAEFFSRLGQGHPGMAASVSMLVVGATVYVDLAFVRRLLCREFCPYGRFQATLVDAGTLTLRFDSAEAERCLRCGACVRACPTGIDIRRGYQIECINCGRCLDACRQVMAKRRQPGLIRYAFGTEGRGPGALLNLRVFLLAFIFLGLTTAVLVGALGQEAATLKVRRSAAPARHLAAGEVASFFTAYVANRSGAPLTVSLGAELENGTVVELRGPTTQLEMAVDERRRIDFAVVIPDGLHEKRLPLALALYDTEGNSLATVRAYLNPSKDAFDEK